MTTVRIALIALVRADGAVLLRMRDEQSVLRPNRWGLPGGAIDAHEDPATTIRRLLTEQTGLTPPANPTNVWRGYLPGVPAEVFLYATATTATLADVTDPPGYVSEFVPGDDVRSGRSFTEASGYVLTRFVDDPQYQALLDQPDPRRLA
jgi:8-oxo-dGTP pyrophosphatase MutT (NUDIX family)